MTRPAPLPGRQTPELRQRLELTGDPVALNVIPRHPRSRLTRSRSRSTLPCSSGRSGRRSTLLKVGHHGSINASPGWSFSEVFPSRQSANAVLRSTESTRLTAENEVPKREVVDGWSGRVRFPSRFRRTDAVPPGSAVEVVFVR